MGLTERHAARAVMAATLLLLSLWLLHSLLVMRYPMQMEPGEGTIAALCATVARGRNLYPPLDRYPYVRTSYTPLYLLAGGVLLRGAGHPFFGPRALTAAAFFALIVLLGWSLQRQAGPLAAWSGVAFFAVNALSFYWSSLIRVDMLALLFDVAALVLILEQRPALAGVAGALAFFTKPTAIGGIVAGAIYLALRDRRALARFVASGLVASGIGAAVCQWVWGSSFWSQIFQYNMLPYRSRLLTYLLGHYAWIAAAPALLALAIPHRRHPLWWLYLGISLAATLGCGRLGAFYNYFLPLQAALAACAALAIAAWFERSRARPVVLAAVLLSVVVGAAVHLPPYLPSPASLVRRDLLSGWPPPWYAHGAGTHRAMCELLRQYPGDVLADNVGNVVACQRTCALTDPGAMYFLSVARLWNDGPLLQRIRERRFAVVCLDTEDAALHFSPDVLRAVNQAYEPRFDVGGIDRIYLPREKP